MSTECVFRTASCLEDLAVETMDPPLVGDAILINSDHYVVTRRVWQVSRDRHALGGEAPRCMLIVAWHEDDRDR